MADSYNATILEKQNLSDELIVLRVKTDFALREFQPGQFAVLGLNVPTDKGARFIRKAYSIASSATQLDYLEFYINLVPGGELTPGIFGLNPGDRLFVGPRISGKFTLSAADPDKHILMIATGTGLAPYMSMIRSCLECGGSRRYVIVHGARYPDELGYSQELSLLARNCLNFHYLPSVTRADPLTWQGLRGRLTVLIPQGIVQKACGMDLKPDVFEAYLCGNPDMIRDMSVYLTALGFQPDQGNIKGTLHTEEYW